MSDDLPSKSTKITVSIELKEQLTRLRGSGQTYGGFITDLLKENEQLKQSLAEKEQKLAKFIRQHGKDGKIIG